MQYNYEWLKKKIKKKSKLKYDKYVYFLKGI